MVKAYVLLLLLLSCNMTMGVKVAAEFDAVYDLIYYNGKIYLPSSAGSGEDLQAGRGLAAADGHSADTKAKATGASTSAHGEEEELGGGQFWFYIFSIGCKKINI